MSIKWSSEQLEAIQKENTNIIVSAGAGSGKTAVLTTRIERKLLEGCKADELLVLTFTNAAAAEMKERIVKKMKGNEQLKNRVEEVDRAYITTFDSFSLSIVKKYHQYLNLSSQISIIESSLINVYKRQVIDELFEEYYQKEDERFEKLLKELTSKNDRTIRKALLKVSDKLDLLEDKEEYLRHYCQENYTENTFQTYLEELNGILQEKLRFIEQNLQALRLNCEEKQYQKYQEAFQNLLNAKDYDEIRYYCKIRMPSCKLDDEAKVYKDMIAQALKDINRLCIYTNTAYAKEMYFSSRPYVEIIIEILLRLHQNVQQYKQKMEVFEFNDIAKMAISLVQNNLEIREELKYSFKEILIDEYQDTSDLQETFISYIANHNVYMVGDIKQSIYRFRNANPMIFKNKYDRYKKGMDGYKIDLNKNFRSNAHVLNFINDLFDHIMDDQIGNANFKQEHRMNYGFYRYDDGTQENKIQYLTYDNSEKLYKKADIDMFIVLKDMQQKLKNKEQVYDKEQDCFRPCEYKDFAILIADSSQFLTIKMLLEYHHIPTSIIKNEEVNNGIIVQIMMDIVKLVLLDENKIYQEEFCRCFYGVGRSFLFEMKDEYLFDILTKKMFDQTSLYEKIHKLSMKLKSISLSKLIKTIIDDFQILQNLIKIGDIEANMTRIQYLINMAYEMEKLQLSISDFVRYVEDIFDNQEKLEFSNGSIQENKVKIMTIHKSKGLEYPIVYFINNFKKFNQDEYKDKIIFDTTYGFITPFYDRGEGKNIHYLLMKEKQNMDMISEEIRLLYVALTRAREQIIVVNEKEKEGMYYPITMDVLPNSIREKYTSFKKIYHSCLGFLKAIEKEIDIQTLGINDLYQQKKEQDYHKLIPKSTIRIEHRTNHCNAYENQEHHASKTIHEVITADQRKNMERGTYLHKIFEITDFLQPNLSYLTKEEKKYIVNFLNQEILKNIHQAKIYKEFEFIEEKQDEQLRGIIDLLLEYVDHIDIIDYKMKQTNDEQYQKQLSLYCHYIQKKKGKPVHLYLYSILHNQMKEVKEIHV